MKDSVLPSVVELTILLAYIHMACFSHPVIRPGVVVKMKHEQQENSKQLVKQSASFVLKSANVPFPLPYDLPLLQWLNTGSFGVLVEEPCHF